MQLQIARDVPFDIAMVTGPNRLQNMLALLEKKTKTSN